jgi:Flp pilus assembly pilin Flp
VIESIRGVESRLASVWLSAGVFLAAMKMAVGERLGALPDLPNSDDGMAVVEYILLLSVGVVVFLAILQALTGSVSAFASRVVNNINSLN